MRREAAILADLAKNPADPAQLVAELDQVRASARDRQAIASAVDWDGMENIAPEGTVREAALSHSSESDWLVNSRTAAEQTENSQLVTVARRQAAEWFTTMTTPVGRQDRREFLTQAKGYVGAWASQFGDRSREVTEEFLKSAMQMAGHPYTKTAGIDGAGHVVRNEDGEPIGWDYDPGDSDDEASWYDDYDEGDDIEHEGGWSAGNTGTGDDGMPASEYADQIAMPEGDGTHPVATPRTAADLTDWNSSESYGDNKKDGGQKCSVCGDAIKKNSDGDGYIHDNGEKHDHEAKAGESKEGTRKVAYDEAAFLNEALQLTQEQAELNRYRVGVWSQDQYEAYMHVWSRNKIGSEADGWRDVAYASPEVERLVGLLDQRIKAKVRHGAAHTAELVRRMASMTDQQAEAAIVGWPTAPKTLVTFKQIAASRVARVIEGTFVDPASAETIVRVHGGLNEANGAKLLALPIDKLGEMAWKLAAKTAEREYCMATTTAHIGNQMPMEVTCYKEKGHDGQHRGTTLDSDDNAIQYTWANEGTTASRRTASIDGVEVGDVLVIQGGFEVVVTDANPDDGGPAGRVMATYVGDDMEMAITADMIDSIRKKQAPAEQLSLMGSRKVAFGGDPDKWYVFDAEAGDVPVEGPFDSAEEARQKSGVPPNSMRYYIGTGFPDESHLTGREGEIPWGDGTTGSLHTAALSDERKQQVENTWYKRKGAWDAPFERILNDVMVNAFFNDDDYDEVQAYLTEKFGGGTTASLRTAAEYGDQRACETCGMDIEYGGPEDGWHDRGGNHYCDESGAAAPLDENGERGTLPHKKHSPYKEGSIHTAIAQSFVIQRGTMVPTAGPFVSKLDADMVAEYLNTFYATNEYVSTALGDYPIGGAKTYEEWRATGDSRLASMRTAADDDVDALVEKFRAKLDAAGVSVSDAAAMSVDERDELLDVAAWGGTEDAAWEKVTGGSSKEASLDRSDLWSIAAEWTGNDWPAPEEATDYDGQTEMPMALADEITPNYIEPDEIEEDAPSGAAAHVGNLHHLASFTGTGSELDDSLDLPRQRQAKRKVRGNQRMAAEYTIDSSTHPWTLNPDDEFWIGRFTDRALNEALAFWQSEAGQNAQPNLPGYADGSIRMITDELNRRGRTASRRTAVSIPARAQSLIRWLEGNTTGKNDDDQVYELGKILGGIGLDWYYGNDSHIRVVDKVQADAIKQQYGNGFDNRSARRDALNALPDARMASRRTASDDVISWARQNAEQAGSASVSKVSGTDVMKLVEMAGNPDDETVKWAKQRAEAAGSASVSQLSGTDLLKLCDMAEGSTKTAGRKTAMPNPVDLGVRRIAMDQDAYDALVTQLMGKRVRIMSGMEAGLEGVVVDHRWRAPNPYGGGVGSYPVFTVKTDWGQSVGGVDYVSLETIG